MGGGRVTRRIVASANAVTLRYFVPEAALAKAQPGASIHFTCDGCGAEKTATITHVAATPEYTPPVIYSQKARAKLVFLVEARPDAIDPRLRPGLPIEVEPCHEGAFSCHRCEGLTKRYGPRTVVDRVDLRSRPAASADFSALMVRARRRPSA